MHRTLAPPPISLGCPPQTTRSETSHNVLAFQILIRTTAPGYKNFHMGCHDLSCGLRLSWKSLHQHLRVQLSRVGGHYWSWRSGKSHSGSDYSNLILGERRNDVRVQKRRPASPRPSSEPRTCDIQGTLPVHGTSCAEKQHSEWQIFASSCTV